MDALLTPAFGTVVWATVAFLVVMFLLRKMAWGPILTALKEREESIAAALNEADKARSEMTAIPFHSFLGLSACSYATSWQYGQLGGVRRSSALL